MFLRLVQTYRARFAVVAVCSVLINVLTFAGSLYMLLVYDSVLPSRSVPTLAGLFVMLVVIFLFQFAFEQIRSEALLGIANHLRTDLFRPVHYATINRDLRCGKGDDDRSGKWLHAADTRAMSGWSTGRSNNLANAVPGLIFRR